MLSVRGAVVAAVTATALATSSGAFGMNPAAALAKSLKSNMQSHYAGSDVKITTVACTVAKSGTSALCHAHFTVIAERAEGIFTVAARIDPSTGGVSTKTTKTVCSDSKTGAKLHCF